MDTDAPTFDPMEWWRFVSQVARGDDQKAIAKRSEVDQSTISRWKNGNGVPDPARVVKFARAYGVPALAALVAAGVLRPEEANARPTITSLNGLDDADLLKEVGRRMRRGGETNGTPEAQQERPRRADARYGKSESESTASESSSSASR